MRKHYGGVSQYRSSEGKTVKIDYKDRRKYNLDLLGHCSTVFKCKKFKDLSKCISFIRLIIKLIRFMVNFIVIICNDVICYN